MKGSESVVTSRSPDVNFNGSGYFDRTACDAICKADRDLRYEDCFAKSKNKCGILKEMLCKRKKCPFYKSRQQYEEEKEKYPIVDYADIKRKDRNDNGKRKTNDT